MRDHPTWLARRAVVAGLGAAAVTRRAQAQDAIAQPNPASPQAFMDRAFAMKLLAEQSGDQAYGAVVVRAGMIVGQAPNAVITKKDPTAHAEMEAIRDAARRLGQRELGDCELYSSSRPCPMCEAAAYWAGIGRMVHGAGLSDAGPPRLSRS
jgi:tRNA(Arg) A34 adenosine deaminase TadA